MSKIIINGKSDGSLKAYVNGNEVNGVMAGGGKAYTRIETEETPEPPVKPSYLCFTAQEAGSTVAFQSTNSPVIVPVLYTSTDGENWSSWDGSSITLANIGDKVYVYGENTRFCDVSGNTPSQYWHYVMTGSISASGDATSMLTKNGTTTLTDDFAMFRLFSGCTSLTTAPELPATTLTSSCYRFMFYGCTNLTTAPALPSTTLASYCYAYMFYGCTSLTTPTALPATTLADRCYQYMFYSCTSLATAPALPATTLADYCYYYMFNECTSLTTAPALPATTLAKNCYYYMFWGCTSLTTAPALPATTLSEACYSYMFYKCTSLTTAPALPATTLAKNCYAYMFNRCAALATAPDLRHVTTTAYACCTYMFQGCTSLTTAYAPDVATWTKSQFTSWLASVAASGTLYATAQTATLIPLNATNGCPSGWTVSYYQ